MSMQQLYITFPRREICPLLVEQRWKLSCVQNSFVVYSVNTNEHRVTVSCGGAHRDWHFILASSSSSSSSLTAGSITLYLVYIKKRSITIYSAPLLPYQTVVQVCRRSGVSSFRCGIIRDRHCFSLSLFRCVIHLDLLSFRCYIVQVCCGVDVLSFRCVIIIQVCHRHLGVQVCLY